MQYGFFQASSFPSSSPVLTLGIATFWGGSSGKPLSAEAIKGRYISLTVLLEEIMVNKKMLLLLLFFALCWQAFPQSTNTRSLSLDEALHSLNSINAGTAGFRWDPFFASGTLTVGRYEAVFSSGRPGETGAVLLDRKDILTLPLPYVERGNIRFPEPFITHVRNTLSSYVEERQDRYRIAAIVIDPGHGGRDHGASETHIVNGKALRSVEKDIVLKVGLQLHALLSAAFPDKQILLTRPDDTFLSLDDRADFANAIPRTEHNDVFFVSIHANASPPARRGQGRGYEVWYLPSTYQRDVIDYSQYDHAEGVGSIINSMKQNTINTENYKLASFILDHLNRNVGDRTPSRGLKENDWFVVKKATMPAVLVELGFVDNRSEAILMDDDDYLKKLSAALYNGIIDFIRFFERN